MTENILYHILRFFPDLSSVLDIYGKDNYEYLKNVTKDIVDSRIEPRGDFIDRLKELKEKLSDDETHSQGTAKDKTL